jgi:hypothetical protein
VWFVLSLVKKYYLRQFSLFAWTHVALLIVVTQSYLIIQNLFQGTDTMNHFESITAPLKAYPSYFNTTIVQLLENFFILFSLPGFASHSEISLVYITVQDKSMHKISAYLKRLPFLLFWTSSEIRIRYPAFCLYLLAAMDKTHYSAVLFCQVLNIRFFQVS